MPRKRASASSSPPATPHASSFASIACRGSDGAFSGTELQPPTPPHVAASRLERRQQQTLQVAQHAHLSTAQRGCSLLPPGCLPTAPPGGARPPESFEHHLFAVHSHHASTLQSTAHLQHTACRPIVWDVSSPPPHPPSAAVSAWPSSSPPPTSSVSSTPPPASPPRAAPESPRPTRTGWTCTAP